MGDTYHKIMLAALIGVLLQVCGVAQQSADNGLNRLKRKIKSDLVEMATYNYESGTWKKVPAYSVAQEYSPEGNVVRQTSYDGDRSYQYRMSYDGEGRITERRHYTLDGNLVDSCVNTHNIRGKLDSSICKSPDGEVLLDYEYKYDGEGREIEFLLKKKGSQPFKRVRTYDDKGNLLEAVSYQGDKHVDKETYSYPSGRRTGRRFGRLQTGEKHETITIYDSEGKPAEHTINVNGSLTRREVLTYNPGGTHAEQALYSSDGKLISRTTYEYKYDREANCIEWERKTTSGEGEPMFKLVMKRTITYGEEISPKPKDLASKQGEAKKLKPRR